MDWSKAKYNKNTQDSDREIIDFKIEMVGELA